MTLTVPIRRRGGLPDIGRMVIPIEANPAGAAAETMEKLGLDGKVYAFPSNTGDDGWSPLFSVVTDGERRVLRIADWTGGGGTKPATGQYLGATGVVATAAAAADIRGASGASIADATTSTKGKVELATNAEIDAESGTGAIVATISGLYRAIARKVKTASTTVAGIVELATQSEADTGTDTARAMTPALVKRRIDAVPRDKGAWAASTAYKVGDDVTHGGHVYRFHTATTGDSTFPTAKVDRIVVRADFTPKETDRTAGVVVDHGDWTSPAGKIGLYSGTPSASTLVDPASAAADCTGVTKVRVAKNLFRAGQFVGATADQALGAPSANGTMILHADIPYIAARYLTLSISAVDATPANWYLLTVTAAQTGGNFYAGDSAAVRVTDEVPGDQTVPANQVEIDNGFLSRLRRLSTFATAHAASLTTFLGAASDGRTSLITALAAFFVKSVTAGNGLTGGGTGGDVSLAVDPGDGIEIDSDKVRVKLDGSSLTRGAAGLKVTNEFTAAKDTKLAGIETGAEVNPSDSDIGDKAFSNPPSDLTDTEKSTVRTRIGAGTSSQNLAKASNADVDAETDDADYVTVAKVFRAIARKVKTASKTVAGIIEIASNSEGDTGTDDTRAMTPAGVRRQTGAQVSSSERSAGTESGVRRFSPADVKSMIDTHAGVGDTPDASTTVKGIVELATSAEAAALTDSTRAVTPSGLITAFSSLTFAASLTWNVGTNPNATITLTGNVTGLTLSGDKDGGVYTLLIKQDTTGSRTFAFPSGWKWAGGSADSIASGAGDETLLTIRKVGTTNNRRAAC